jgi:glycosyltransferase involved in cell wall biosynthesis
LAVAPYCDGQDVGEAWCAHQWIKHLAERADVTLLTLHRKGRTPASEQLPNVEVIEWDERLYFEKFSRLSSMLKPGYVSFYKNAQRWIEQAIQQGRVFDIGHQFTPIALRYPSPLAQFPIPFVLGPQGGSLETPAGFAAECQSSAWYTRLRGLDSLRLRRDTMLRNSYRSASLILGVAPYVADLLGGLSQRFEVISELGIEKLAAERPISEARGHINLVHVGRGVRTKGLRDAVRALAKLPQDVSAHLDVAGSGEEIAICQDEAKSLGVADKITFHGQVSREEVEELYRQADAFLFPSFREPSGSVVFEAMRNGLPVITTDRGGPGFVVDASCGITVPANFPEQLAADLGAAITSLARKPELRRRLALGSRDRIASIGLWDNKIEQLLNFYEETLTSNSQPTLEEAV